MFHSFSNYFLATPASPLALFFVFLVGLTFGSFATMVIHRLPEGNDLVFKRSHCPKCKKPLGVFDLIPFFSWLFSAGRCRKCGVKIPLMYPLTELATGLAFVWVVGSFGFTAHALILAALALALIIMTGIDFRYMIIPDSLQILMALLGVAYIFIAQRPLEMLFVGPLIGFAFAYALRAAMFAWKKREALGFGDVKFFAVVGLYLDSKEIVAFLFLSGAIGIAIAALWRGMKRGEAFPFGPALGFALFLCLMLPLSIDRLL